MPGAGRRDAPHSAARGPSGALGTRLPAVVAAILARAGDGDAGGFDGAVASARCRVWTPSAAVAGAVGALAHVVPERPRAGAAPADAVLLLDGELADAGEHAEGLLADTAQLVRPGGLLAVSAAPTLLPPAEGGRAFAADELARLLGHRGFRLEALWAPGTAQRLRGAGDDFDPHLDARPGLLDAGDVVVAVGRLATTPADRSERFFATLPRKVIAAAVVCRDEEDRLLLVHDSFKQHWTVPGGVVDAEEDPRTGAVREAWEEAGVRVRAGALLGVFAGVHPDRLVLLYAAAPVEARSPQPAPRHPHEIDAAEWVPLGDALARLAPSIRAQVTRCLDDPGRTWPAGSWEP